MIDTADLKNEVERALKKPIGWNTEKIPWLYDGDCWTLAFEVSSANFEIEKLRRGKTGDPIPLVGAVYRAPIEGAVFAFRSTAGPSPVGRHDLILMRI